MNMRTRRDPVFRVPIRARSLSGGRKTFDLLYAALGGSFPLPNAPIGLVGDLDVIASDTFARDRIDPLLCRFYTETSEFTFESTHQWLGLFQLVGPIYDRVARRLQQLAPGGRSGARFEAMDSVLAHAKLPGGSWPDARIWWRMSGPERRTFYTAVVRACVGPRRGGGTVTHLHCVFPYAFGHLGVVLEFIPTGDGGLRVSSRPEDGQGVETGTYLHLGLGPFETWRRAPLATGERIDFRVERGRTFEAIRVEHTASVMGTNAMRLTYIIKPAR